MPPFANRTALVTGAARGIGRQLTLDLIARGAAVAAVDRDTDALARLAAELPDRPFAWAAADVTDLPALLHAVGRLHERLGPPDLLFANAGVGRETSALKFRAAEFAEIVRVNLLGVANSLEAVLPGMLERRRGHVVGISSLASYRGIPGMAAYCASKSGVNALLEAVRPEVQPFGVAVTIVCPGWIRTDMTAGLDLPPADLLDPADAVRRILTAVERRQPFVAFPAGAARRVRLLRWLPCGVSDWLLGRALRALRRK